MLIEVICAVGRICRMNQRFLSLSTTIHHSPYAAICNNKYNYSKIHFILCFHFTFYNLFLLIKGIFPFQTFFALGKVSVSVILPWP